MKTKKSQAINKPNGFDPQGFLETVGISRKISEYRRNESIFNQGDLADSVMYIQKGWG